MCGKDGCPGFAMGKGRRNSQAVTMAAMTAASGTLHGRHMFSAPLFSPANVNVEKRTTPHNLHAFIEDGTLSSWPSS